jgi:hypothetical protein
MSALRHELEAELKELNTKERELDDDLLSEFAAFGSIADSRHTINFDSADFMLNLTKIEQYAPALEAMEIDSCKLATQIKSCRALSDRLSIMVRQLDVSKIRSQQALTCAESILNIKAFKLRLQTAIDEENLVAATESLSLIKAIDERVTSVCEDQETVRELEEILKRLVRKAFNVAIKENDISSVISMCPLLQPVGLEIEARETFLAFMEETILIAISADASIENATDTVTGYAESLSNIFNTASLILQQYLPFVIKGMDSSLGDIFFLRRLHAKCEKESGVVLKRYMKHRNIKQTVTSVKNASTNHSHSSITSVEMHVILDELALMIQYCSVYGSYIKKLAHGAQSRQRPMQNQEPENLSNIEVFSQPISFDVMVEELVSRYYMEGEHWLMSKSVRSCIESNMCDIDECFFVLQKCGLRSLATGSIHATCAILHLISDMVVSDMAKQLTANTAVSAGQIGSSTEKHILTHLQAEKNAFDDESDDIKRSQADELCGDVTTVAIEWFNITDKCGRYVERLAQDILTAGASIYPEYIHESGHEVSSDYQKFKVAHQELGAARSVLLEVSRRGAELVATKSKNTISNLVSLFWHKLPGRQRLIDFELEDEQFNMQSSLNFFNKEYISLFDKLLQACTDDMNESIKVIIVDLIADDSVQRLENFISQTKFSISGALYLEKWIRSLNSLFMRFSPETRGKFYKLREPLLAFRQ